MVSRMDLMVRACMLLSIASPMDVLMVRAFALLGIACFRKRMGFMVRARVLLRV